MVMLSYELHLRNVDQIADAIAACYTSRQFTITYTVGGEVVSQFVDQSLRVIEPARYPQAVMVCRFPDEPAVAVLVVQTPQCVWKFSTDDAWALHNRQTEHQWARLYRGQSEMVIFTLTTPRLLT
jgi:hypothetical protein